MDLRTVLLQKSSSILKQWFELVIQSYADDTTQFLRRQKDPIANPVGAAIRDGLEGIFKGLIEAIESREGDRLAFDPDRIRPLLDRIVRIRALQNIKPSESIGFVSDLKTVLRDAAGKDAGAADLAAMDAWVDALLFLAFDVYSACREDLHEVRLKDERRRVHMLLRRANIICESDGEPTNLPDFRKERSSDPS